MTINIELLDRALAHIDAHPDQWDQESWCGTAQCVAGWVCTIAGRTHDGDNTSLIACDLLGLRGGSHPMFSAQNNRTALAVWRAVLAGDSLPDLRNADLRWADLRGIDLSGAHLRGGDLRGADLSNADLSSADLQNAVMTNATLTEAKLIKADLRKTDLRNAIMTDALLIGADMRWAELTGADLGGADLSWASLQSASMTEATLTKAKLNHCYLCRVDLSGADLTDADLREAVMTGADLRDTDMTRANLIQAKLTGADLRIADLTNADLSNAILTDADLREAVMTDAVTTDATLTGARLTYYTRQAIIMDQRDGMTKEELQNVYDQAVSDLQYLADRLPDYWAKDPLVWEELYSVAQTLFGLPYEFEGRQPPPHAFTEDFAKSCAARAIELWPKFEAQINAIMPMDLREYECRIRARAEVGKLEHGGYMMPHNGRDWREDAVQKLLDCIVFQAQGDLEDCPR